MKSIEGCDDSPMRVVGIRRARPISLSASAELLREGARFNDEIHRLPSGGSGFIPKGVYRFMTHEAANRHQQDCVAQGMAKIARSGASLAGHCDD